ncbi:MAG: hypothetical protein Q9168_005874, partial [Polycauliona sp. 1 TL-2023]
MSKDTLDEAERFLAPILSRSIRRNGSQSIIDTLWSEELGILPNNGNTQYMDRRQIIIQKTLELLANLHEISCKTSQDPDQARASATDSRVIDALLDLVVIEGIYPCLMTGVGIPIELRLKSALKGDVSVRQLSQQTDVPSHDVEIIKTIIDCLYPILRSRNGLASSVETRMLVDLIAIVGQAAFSSALAAGSRQQYTTMFDSLLDRPSIDILPILTSLLHPSCPDWLRSPISNRLSLLPLRPDGVRHILNFIAGSTSGDAHQPANQQGNQQVGPDLTLEALARATKLLTSIPSTMTADEYFSALAPQLLDLLDDQNVDNKRIASYIIGNGILGKRRIGSPGTIGWKLFAAPILETINPRIERCPVNEKPLKQAIDRLSALVQFHPNSGLTKRLVIPLLLPLWSLEFYALSNFRTNWADQVHRVLSIYMKLSATATQLLLLSDHLLWDGPPAWTFMPGDEGGIEIRERRSDHNDNEYMGRLIESIDSRVEQFSSLLRGAVLTDDQMSTIFTHTCKRWLDGSQMSSGNDRLDIGDEDPRDPMETLVSAKLAQRLLGDFKDQIASSMNGILQIVEPILSAFTLEHREKKEWHTNASSVRYRLNTIVDDESDGNETGDESTQTVATALSLLSATLAPSDKPIEANDSVLQSIKSSLQYIAQSSSSLDSSITTSASNILILLQLRADISAHFGTTNTPKVVDPHATDRQAHRTALTHLQDDLAPIRAQGLSTLTALISKSSPILNIPSTSILLLSLLQDPDSYIYLSAIRALETLALSHPNTVIQQLLDQYADASESLTLDTRIRLGEALDQTIQHLNQLFTPSIAKNVCSTLLAIASRRGHRPLTFQKTQRSKQKLEKAKCEAEEAWDGEIPSLSNNEHDTDNTAAVNEHSAKIMDGWSDTGREEDIRIRTSALSILATAIITNIAAIGPTTTSSAIDLVLSILKLETQPPAAILRRAAVIVLLNLIRAFDAAEEKGVELGFGFAAGGGVEEVLTVL